MIKKLLAVFLVLFLIGLGIWRLKEKTMISPTPENTPFSKSKQEYDYQWTTWKDPAGFSFEYPQKTEVNDHPEDEINYARLTLSQQDHLGKITIICNDSEYGDLDTWLKNNESVKNANALETEIASTSGRKLSLGQGKEMVAFIDWDEVLYTIEIEAQDQDYWYPIHKHLLETFKLTPLEGETETQFTDWLKGFDTTGADVVEPVELIQ